MCRLTFWNYQLKNYIYWGIITSVNELPGMCDTPVILNLQILFGNLISLSIMPGRPVSGWLHIRLRIPTWLRQESKGRKRHSGNDMIAVRLAVGCRPAAFLWYRKFVKFSATYIIKAFRVRCAFLFCIGVHTMKQDLTQGNILKTMLIFAFPMMIGNMLQQLYNVVDTLIVGQFLGADALAAVGSSYTLMTFLTSILLGLCMGSGTMFSICYGKKDFTYLKSCMFVSFLSIVVLTIVLNTAVFAGLDKILILLQVPARISADMRDYLWVVFWGIAASFLYNYFASLLRAVGNSVVPLLFLGASALLNIVLDLIFILVFHWGVTGAAAATVFSQYVSGIGIMLYTLVHFPEFRPKGRDCRWNGRAARDIFSLSFLTCIQQSVMNFGILMVQGRVNSFGASVMAAFAAAVKIDSFAYMPVQDFGNAFSTFIAQNYGAGKRERMEKSIRSAVKTVVLFCIVITAGVCIFAEPLMLIFVKPDETEILITGIRYLRIEGAFYWGIGLLFLFYGLYRAVKKPGISVVLTVISLGTRVLLAYILSSIPAVGVNGIWVSIPVGWMLADITGFCYYLLRKERLL